MPATRRAPVSDRAAVARGLLRPHARPVAARIRLGHRLAAGLTPAQAARVEGVEPAEVDDLLADPDFARLVEECRALDAMPDEAAVRRLTSLAYQLLEYQIHVGDFRAACFVLRETGRGRHPGRVLADGVLAARRRAAAMPSTATAASPPPPPPMASRPPRAAESPADRLCRGAAARLRVGLRREVAAIHSATREIAPTAAPVSADDVATPAPPLPGRMRATATKAAASSSRPGNRRERRRVAALRRRAGGAAGPSDRPPSPRARSP